MTQTLLSNDNSKLRIQFTQDQENDWEKVAWSDKFQFLLQHSDVKVRKSIYNSCFVSMVQTASGAMVLGRFN